MTATQAAIGGLQETQHTNACNGVIMQKKQHINVSNGVIMQKTQHTSVCNGVRHSIPVYAMVSSS